MKHVSVFLWQGLPSTIRNRLSTVPQPFFPGLADATNHRGSITVTGQKQGQIDSNKRDALRRGGR